MIFFLQEMREQKKRITDLDWSLANDQLLTSSGAVSVAVLVHPSWHLAYSNMLLSI